MANADYKLNRNSRSFVRERTENRMVDTLNMTSSESTNGTTFAMRGECDVRDSRTVEKQTAREFVVLK